jgi:hypothetical protein
VPRKPLICLAWISHPPKCGANPSYSGHGRDSLAGVA